jgi:trigger factor
LRIVWRAVTVGPHMKIEVETQPHSVATLRIELPPEDVRKEWDALAASYARYARIPGFRAGKAPKAVIEKKFRKEIQDELTKKLVSKSYHEAIAEKQLRVVSLTNLEDVEFGDDRSMRFPRDGDHRAGVRPSRLQEHPGRAAVG